MNRTRISRVHIELYDAIKDFAIKNNIKFVEASREIAKIEKARRGKKYKLVEEIQF